MSELRRLDIIFAQIRFRQGADTQCIIKRLPQNHDEVTYQGRSFS